MIIDPSITKKAQELMRQRAIENGAPAWGLIEIAAKAAEKLAILYGVDVGLALVASYLCHIVFSHERGSERMRSHADLSADEAEMLLSEWGVDVQTRERISHAIRNHHSTETDPDILAEIVKQADTYKFLTTKGLFIFMVNLDERGMSLQEAIEYSIFKVKQKYAYVSLPEVRDDLAEELQLIQRTFNIEI